MTAGPPPPEFRPLADRMRPRNLDEFIGQAEARANLRVFIESARRRGEAMDHTLFHGPPGLGKTTLAQIVARELGVGFHMTSGPVMLMTLEGVDAIKRWRSLIGATNPEKADPGTIRRDMATSIERNVVHGSDAVDTASFEVNYFFTGTELMG